MDIRQARTQTSAVSEHAQETGTILSGTRSSLLIEILTGTHVGSRKLRRKDINRDSEADLSDINDAVQRRPQRQGRCLARNKHIFYRRHSRFFLDLLDTFLS